MVAETPSLSSHTLGYRSDIEGLRALGIALVVAAHAGVGWLSGGFVGVDVFYVLSGYLITGLLVREAATTGTIQLVGFYARRLRRLLPALLLMLIVTGAVGYLFMPPAEQPSQATAGVAAAFWASNVYFALALVDYFGPGSEENLYLHTWSLAVEEQFYVVWPALLVGLWRSMPAKVSRASRLMIAMSIVLAASLATCVVLTQIAPQLAFYMMPTRAWQFALGALVFLRFGSPNTCGDGHVTSSRPSQNASGTAPWGWIGLALILGSAVTLGGALQYPGAWALLPSVGTAMVLACGAAFPVAGAGRLLSLPPLQFIGSISYAWYLWHWPVLLLGAQVMDATSGLNRLALVAVSFGIAVATHHLVETPVRRNTRWIGRPGVAVLIALVAMALVNVLALGWRDAAIERLAQPDFLRYQRVQFDQPLIYSMGCDDWYHSAAVRVCEFGSSDASNVAVAIGDSIGLQWFPAMAETFDEPDWRLLVITKSACPMVDAPLFYRRIGREYTECAAWREEAVARIAKLKPDVVLMGSSDTYAFDERDWVEGTARVLETLSASAGRVYVLRATPGLPFDGPDCLAPLSVLQKRWTASPCAAPAYGPRAERVSAWLGEAVRRFPNVRLVDMNNDVCPDGQCLAERDGLIVFRDSQHLTAEFSLSLAGALAERVLSE